jgi:hypothetical protein
MNTLPKELNWSGKLSQASKTRDNGQPSFWNSTINLSMGTKSLMQFCNLVKKFGWEIIVVISCRSASCAAEQFSEKESEW